MIALEILNPLWEILPDMSGGHLPPAPLALYTEILPWFADVTKVRQDFP
ncbi:MAG TPA: hypothetical protein VFE61_04445 [Candidatus Sulfotelmatobacter sp.]|nr:hypothetical protein [Candidatus Sulfotelmatobacter sp.]